MAAKFRNLHTTLWKNEKFTLTKVFFRKINSLVIYLVNALLSRNFSSVRVNFSFFHSVVWWFQKFFPTWRFFSSNRYTLYSINLYLVKKLVWRNFCKKIVGEKFSNFHNVKENFSCSTEIFREINYSVSSLVKKLFSRNFCSHCKISDRIDFTKS